MSSRRAHARQRLDGVARVRMYDVQRGRILAAAVEVACEFGYGGMSMARVTARAGVSRRTFYELFDDREDCFLAAFDHAFASAAALVEAAYAQPGSWRRKVRAGLSSVLQFVEDEPGLSALLVVHALGGGNKVLERRSRGLAELARIVDRGRGEVRSGEGPPPLTAEGIVGAVFSVLHARLLECDRQPADDLLNPLMAMIVLPYLGRTAAKRELAARTPPPPASRRVTPPPARFPLDDLGMRFTFRTLHVLSAIAEHPSASNRRLAGLSGIADQGQISKLLTRLQGRGLIHNAGRGHATGEPNAWTLTAKGEEVQRALDIQIRPSAAVSA